VNSSGPFAGRTVNTAARLRGELRLPSDKSIAHRALLFNAMATGVAEITLERPGQDVVSTAMALRTLGAVEPLGSGQFRVHGGGATGCAALPGTGGETLDCGNSGTSARLFSGALAGRSAPGAATLIGDASLSGRPMERVAAPLRAMGADVSTTDGHLPMRIGGGATLRAMEHRLPVASAQVLGAVTLAALAADGTTTIDTPGPTRDHTERLLGWLGARVRRDGFRTTVAGPTGFRARSIAVPADISSAAAWLVAGSIHPDAEIALPGVGINPSRTAIIDVLREMGADIEIQAAPDDGPEPVARLVVRSAGRLHPIELHGERIAELIDELPLLSIAMAAADGTSTVRDAGELRVKESDRIALVVANLRQIGVAAEELPDGWLVRGGVRAGVDAPAIETKGDHRIAISFAVAALTGLVPSVVIDDPACVEVSYPGFWDDVDAVAEQREPVAAE
jgi:3-phosphoshikimate 1-carboxyvinyltransferase